MKIETLTHYIENSQARGEYWFFRKTVMQALNVGLNAFQKSAARLIEQGKIARLKSDIYIIIPPEHRAVGCLPTSWFIDVMMRHFNQPYYVGLLSAAALHGAAHQQPMVFQVITTKSIRPIVLGQVRLMFCYKKNILPNFYQPIKTASGTMLISTPEMTAFDLVRYAHVSGQLNHVATVLAELAETIDSEKLASFVQNDWVEIATAQRLGYLLEQVSDLDLTHMENALKQKKIIPRLLVVSKKSGMQGKNMRWNLLINEALEIDDL